MEFSNKSLALMVIAALTISLFGTLFVTKELNSSQGFGSDTTGFATNNQTGQVNISIEKAMSIAVRNASINFGSCSIDTGQGYSMFDSALGATDATVNNSECVGGIFPGFLVVENDGNVNVNLSVRINQTGINFFNDPNSWYSFKTVDDPGRPGCAGNLQTIYTKFDTADANMLACDNLTATDSNDRIRLSMLANISSTATGGGIATITFEANAHV